MVPRHPLGPRAGRGAVIFLPASVDTHGPTLLLTCSPGTGRGLCALYSSGTLHPTASALPSSPQGHLPSFLDPSWLAGAFICIFLPLFPAGGNQGVGRGGGGLLGGARAQAPNAAAAGSRAGWSSRGRAAHCSPSPSPSLGLHTRRPAAASLARP